MDIMKTARKPVWVLVDVFSLYSVQQSILLSFLVSNNDLHTVKTWVPAVVNLLFS